MEVYFLFPNLSCILLLSYVILLHTLKSLHVVSIFALVNHLLKKLNKVSIRAVLENFLLTSFLLYFPNVVCEVLYVTYLLGRVEQLTVKSQWLSQWLLLRISSKFTLQKRREQGA